MKQGTWELIDLYPSAYIRIKYQFFHHYAIYIGNNEVIEFGSAKDVTINPDEIKVQKVTLDEFAQGADFIEVYKYSKDELKIKKKDEDICKYAIAHLGDKGYNILVNNCEHFCNEAIFGLHISKEVESIAQDIDNKLSK